MSDEGLQQARDKMAEAGVDPVAIEVFAHYYRLVESGETGMVPESTIEPLDMPALADAPVPDDVARAALATTAVIKLNGGLGTSMGMERAKSLLEVRDGLTFLDVIVRQVLAVREPLRRTAAADLHGQLPHLRGHPRCAGRATPTWSDGRRRDCRCDFLQNKEPKLRSDDLTPVEWPADPALEWCPPGHGDLYTALRGTGLLDRLIEAGFTQAFVSNSDNLGAVPDPAVAGWFAALRRPLRHRGGAPHASDRKGGHFATPQLRRPHRAARDRADPGRGQGGARRPRRGTASASTNNLWFDLAAMRDELDRRDGILGLAMIRNTKNVDPADKQSPEVIQIETAMGAAIEVFDGATTIEVTRDRFVPVKTTNDLLVLRSDCYELTEDHRAASCVADDGPVRRPRRRALQADRRLRRTLPRRRAVAAAGAGELVVSGDWTFGAGRDGRRRTRSLDDPGDGGDGGAPARPSGDPRRPTPALLCGYGCCTSCRPTG